jgi:hypothetical protein
MSFKVHIFTQKAVEYIIQKNKGESDAKAITRAD